jgi:hypothetical protein
MFAVPDAVLVVAICFELFIYFGAMVAWNFIIDYSFFMRGHSSCSNRDVYIWLKLQGPEFTFGWIYCTWDFHLE